MNPVADDAAVETLELVDRWLRTNGLPRRRRLPPARGRRPRDTGGPAPDGAARWFVASRRRGAVLSVVLVVDGEVGRPTVDVHQGVAHYVEELALRVDRFFDRMRPARPCQAQRNLSVEAVPLLFVPLPRRAQPVGDLSTTENGSPVLVAQRMADLAAPSPKRRDPLRRQLQLAPASVLIDRPNRPRIYWRCTGRRTRKWCDTNRLQQPRTRFHPVVEAIASEQ